MGTHKSFRFNYKEVPKTMPKDDKIMSQLKPCPFCGGPASEQQVPGSYGGYNLTEIRCKNCGASVPNREKWNQREGLVEVDLAPPLQITRSKARQIYKEGVDRYEFREKTFLNIFRGLIVKWIDDE